MFAYSWMLYALLLYMSVLTLDTSAKHVHSGGTQYRNAEGNEVEIRRLNKHDSHNMVDKPGSHRAIASRSCLCLCREKWSADTWRCCECTVTESGCFPAIAQVTLTNGTFMKMADLTIGQTIMTMSDGLLIPTRVVGFLERRPATLTRYRTIHTASGHALTASLSHLIYSIPTNTTDTPQPRYISDLNTGDNVITSTGLKTEIVHATEEIFEGVYSPLTEAGTLLVGGILASCYASFDHNVAHLASSPMRWFEWISEAFTPESGTHPYVRLLKQLGRWILPSSMLYNKANNDKQANNISDCDYMPHTWTFLPSV